MQTLKGLRFFLAVLLLVSSIFHFIIGYSLLATEFTPSIIDLVFGLVYIFLGIGVLLGKRIFYYFCIIIALVDGLGGIFAHITSQALAPLVAASIDLAIIIISIVILIRRNQTSP